MSERWVLPRIRPRWLPRGRSESVEGTVCITASEAITAFLLPPILQGLRLEHPGISLELIASNEVRDLQRREADIAIRNFAPKSPI